MKRTTKNERPRIILSNRALILKRGKILIIKRWKRDEVQPNKWELPGGKLDIGQDITHALEREVLEETGLVVVPNDKVVYSHSEISVLEKYKGMPYVLLVGLAKWIGGEVTISKEHSDFAWVTMKEALKYDLTNDSRSAITVLSRRK